MVVLDVLAWVVVGLVGLSLLAGVAMALEERDLLAPGCGLVVIVVIVAALGWLLWRAS